MPEVEFTIDTATGELQMHVQGVADPPATTSQSS